MDFQEEFNRGSSDNIQVYARIRPPSDQQERYCAFATSNTTVKLERTLEGNGITGKTEEATTFEFDYVASPHVSQETFFEKVGKPMAEYCLSGYNGCIFAYGQTGSGKTFTIQGPDGAHSAADKGLTVRVMDYIFRHLARTKRSSTSNFEYFCECSYIELYQENFTDLLTDEVKKLELREDHNKNVYVENMTKVVVSNSTEAESLFLCGAKKRHVAASKANKQSSRSHAIYTIYIQTQELNDTGVTAIKSSMLHIVDLAGSERQKNTGATGTRLQEAGNINKSLSALGMTIRALVKKDSRVPYRDSKLTFLLRQSLGGNSKTSIIATIDPRQKSYGETISTLRFAERAKKIKNNAYINEHSAGTLSQMQAELKRLQQEIQLYRTGQGLSSSANGHLSSNGANNSNNQVNVERDERIIELEELCREMVDRWQKSGLERDNFALKIADLQQLLVAKDYWLESSRLVSRLREEKLERIRRCGDDEAYCKGIEVSKDEIASLQTELDTLRFQMDRHPDVIRVSIENRELKEILEQYEAYYGQNGKELTHLRSLCSKFSTQLIKLSNDKAKLIALLKADATDGEYDGKLDAWEHEVAIEQLEAEIERIKMEALEQLSVSDQRESALAHELSETKSQLRSVQESFTKMEEAHAEERMEVESRFNSLTDRVKESYETQIKALYERLEHAKVSSVTVLTMEKQLSEQSTEFVELQKKYYEMESDLRLLTRFVDVSFSSNFIPPPSPSASTTESESGPKQDAPPERNSNDLLTTPKKKFMAPSIRDVRSPIADQISSPWTPSGRCRNRTTPGRLVVLPNTLTVARLAVHKIQELQTMVADYQSKLDELEDTIAQNDGSHLAEITMLEERLGSQDDKLSELEMTVTELQQKEAASKEELESLESQLEIHNQLLEEKEEESKSCKAKISSLEVQLEEEKRRKKQAEHQMNELVSRLKAQKDEEVLIMMQRQDELEMELAQSKKELSQTLAQALELQGANGKLEEELTHAQSTIADTRTLVRTLTTRCSDQEQKLQEQGRTIKDFTSERENWMLKLAELEEAEESLVALKNDNDDLTSQCKESAKALKEKSTMCRSLEEEIAKLNEQRETERRQFDASYEDLQADNDQLAHQLHQSHQQSKMFQTQLAERQQDVTKADAKIAKLDSERKALATLAESIGDANDNLKSQIAQLEQANAHLLQLKESLETQTSTLLEERKTIRAQLEEALQDLDESNSNLESKKQQIHQLLTEGTEEEQALRRECEELKSQNQTHHSTIHSLKSTITIMKTDIFTLHENQASKETELEQKLQLQLDNIVTIKRQMESDRRKNEEEKGDLLQKLAAAGRQVKEISAKADQEKDELVAQINTLKGELSTLKSYEYLKPEAVNQMKSAADQRIQDMKNQMEIQASIHLAESISQAALIAQIQSEANQIKSQNKELLGKIETSGSELLQAKDKFADFASQDHGKIKMVQEVKNENNRLRLEISSLKAKLGELITTVPNPTEGAKGQTNAKSAATSTSSSSSDPTPTTTSNTVTNRTTRSKSNRSLTDSAEVMADISNTINSHENSIPTTTTTRITRRTAGAK